MSNVLIVGIIAQVRQYFALKEYEVISSKLERGSMKTNEEKAEYMRLYRKTHPLYMQKHYAVNKLKWKQFKQSHESNIKNMVIEELLEEIRELPSLYTHQRDWIERTEVLTCIKKKLSPKEDK